jgi:hypothetical protein
MPQFSRKTSETQLAAEERPVIGSVRAAGAPSTQWHEQMGTQASPAFATRKKSTALIALQRRAQCLAVHVFPPLFFVFVLPGVLEKRLKNTFWP